MPRPNQSEERRTELVPIIARTFSELGYRRTTTAILAERCDVRENILYRLWPDKRAMFVAAIEYVFELSRQKWIGLLDGNGSDETAAERLLTYETDHHGEFGLYRIVFAGLSETDDPQIRAAIGEMYKRFHAFIRERIADHRGDGTAVALPDPELSAWAIIGLGTVANIGRELALLSDQRRKRLIHRVGRLMLDGGPV